MPTKDSPMRTGTPRKLRSGGCPRGTPEAKGLRAAVLSPIGFVCDHVEVLYDLDREAAETCREAGITMTRARAVNDDPVFLDLMADVVREVCARDGEARRLPIVSAPEGRPREGVAPSRGR